MERDGDENQAIKIDASEEKPFLSFFAKLPEKPATTIRIFDHDDYYTCHGADAVFAANELFHSKAVLKFMGSGGKKVEYVTMSKTNFEAFLRDLLLVRQYRVEMFINHGTKSNPNWELGHTGSPGNLFQFEDVLFGSSSQSVSSLLAAIKFGQDQGQKTVGLAVLDPGARHIFVKEFPDNETFSALEAVLVQIDPKECLIPVENAGKAAESTSKASPGTSVSGIVERAGILVSSLPKADFSSKDVVQDLSRLLKFKKGILADAAVIPETQKLFAMGALAGIIKFLKLMSDESNFSTYKIQELNSSTWMRLDAAAVKALNVLPLPNESSKTGSLLGILSKCRTAQGQRRLRQWIKQPLTDVNKIEERLNVVETFVMDTSLKLSLREDMLRKLPDFQRIKKRLLTGSANLQDYYRLYTSLNGIPSLLSSLSANEGTHISTIDAMFVQPLQQQFVGTSKLLQMIEFSVDLDKAANGEFVIKTGVDEDLDGLLEELSNLAAAMKADWDVVMKDLQLDSKSLKLESTDQLGYFYRVTMKDEKTLRNNSKYKMIDANKAGFRFASGTLKRLNAEYMTAKKSYNEQEVTIVKELCKVAVTYLDTMQAINDITAELDILCAFAAAATSVPIPYVRPKILPASEGRISLVNARHPCLELQDGISFIPNSAEFRHDGKRFWIITGPNMGGKSTFIRSVGCAVLMAQLGSFVACDEAVISVRDGILARVGAGDDATRGVSTFMAEMLDAAAILRSATDKSLIIIDELGRGTSTYDGFGLAWGISEHIARKLASFCLFATHFHELTALDDEVDCVGNVHVSAVTSNDQLTLLYEVKPGVCDQSFGIHVAEMVKFPVEVIQDARRKLALLEDFSSDVVKGTELEGSTAEAAKRRRETKEAGRKLIADFVGKMKQYKKEGMSAEEAFLKMQEMKRLILTEDNLYVKDLLARNGIQLN